MLKRIRVRLVPFLKILLICEIVLLPVIAILWILSGWRNTTALGSALMTVAGLIIAMALLMMAGNHSQWNEKLAEAELTMELRSLNRPGHSQFGFPDNEPAKLATCMFAVGLITLLIGIALNYFSLGLG